MAPPASDQASTEARPDSWVPVLEEGLFAPKKMRVITVGAGHAGLMVAYKMRHEVQCEGYVDHVIYEKNVRIENRPSFSIWERLIWFSSMMLVELGWKIAIQVLRVMFRRTSTPSPGSPTRTGPRTMSGVMRSGTISRTHPTNTTLPETSSLNPRCWKLSGTSHEENGRSRLTRTGR